MVTIAIMNQKGGVGKTTTAVNLAVGLRKFHDKRVLLVDMDPQANASIHLGIRAEGQNNSMTAVFSGDKGINEIIRQSEDIDIAPSHASLYGINEIGMKNVNDEEITALRLAIEGLDYDIAIIDCPSSPGLLSSNALVASDKVIVPAQGEYLSVEGLAYMIQTIDTFRKRRNPNLAILGILITNMQKTVMYNTMRDFINKKLNGRISIFETVIRRNTLIAEASAVGKSIYNHKKCNGYTDYLNFTYEIKQKLSEEK
jgi:chromosome partitioning protein